MDLAARHAQVLADQIRHGFLTRAPYQIPIAQARARYDRGAWPLPETPALEQLARQDRIRLRALCAGLRLVRAAEECCLRRDPLSGNAYARTHRTWNCPGCGCDLGCA